MNKTVTTNIGGFIFHIDDIAYEKLSQYLNTIKGYFKHSEGRDEIIGDIEARIAEMFREKTANVKQVISLKDVDEVIAVMGQPEAFAESGEATGAAYESVADDNGYGSRKRRRVFRDPDDKIVGGVCSGISNYFDIDPIWLRLAFAIALFVYGTGVVLYFVLWLIIPKAKTTAEKLEMRGERVNVHNIERTIREEMNELKERLNNLSGDTKDMGGRDGRVRSFLSDMFGFLASFFRLLFKAIVKIIGVLFLVLGILFLIVTVASLMGMPGYVSISDHGHETRATVHQIMTNFIGSSELVNWSTLGLALLFCIPLIAIIYAGVKILFNIKGTNKYIGWTAGGLWVIGFIICSAVAINVLKDFTTTSGLKDNYIISKPANSEILYLGVNNNHRDEEDGSTEIDEWMFFADDDTYQLYKKPELDIEKSETDSIELEMFTYARGPSRKEAIDRAGRVQYSYEVKDSLVLFDKYMNLEVNDKWRFQDVKMILRIPVGQTIYLSKEMVHIIYDVDNVTNTWDSDMINRRWKMTENGLACIDCNNLQNIGDVDDEDDVDWHINDSIIREQHRMTPTPQMPEAPAPPAPPAPPGKQKKKSEAAVSDSITREQYELLSKLNRMYLELKYPDTNMVL